MSYVYVITDDMPMMENGRICAEYVKIGFTSDKDIQNRVKQLQTGNPRPLWLICSFEFQDSDMARQMERLSHWNLKPHRAMGEWFYYNDEVHNFLATLKKVSNFKEGEVLMGSSSSAAIGEVSHAG